MSHHTFSSNKKGNPLTNIIVAKKTAKLSNLISAKDKFFALALTFLNIPHNSELDGHLFEVGLVFEANEYFYPVT